MLVSFTDEEKEEMLSRGYICDQSELGDVYYPTEGVKIADKIAVNYVVYPWLERCEAEGIEIER